MANRARAVRINAVAMVAMLLIGYGFGRAVTEGPAAFTIHALLGVALMVGSIALIVRACSGPPPQQLPEIVEDPARSCMPDPPRS